MQIITHIYNNKNVVIRNFTIQYLIESEEQDSPRDKIIGEHLKCIAFDKKPRYILEFLEENPDECIARTLDFIGIGCWNASESHYETATDTDNHATLHNDFSLLICSRYLIQSYTNIFDFMDGKLDQNYPEWHPIHSLLIKVKRRFGCEHILHWAKAA